MRSCSRHADASHDQLISTPVPAEHVPRPPIIAPGYTYGYRHRQDQRHRAARRTPRSAGSSALRVAFALVHAVPLCRRRTCSLSGVGIWGINIPVAWGFAIVNFVWWIGIGHAGTLISAILLLLHQHWRTRINRFAEAMTLFAVACAGLFPLLHLGRPWLFYWLFPYPNTMGLWPQFRSPLVWDVFAVSTYVTVSLLFWYVGLIPDLATLRDRAHSRSAQITYGILALGWRGSARHWQRYETAYLLLARPGDAAGDFRPQRRRLRFRRRHRARLAHHHLSALLRGRRHLLRLRHGAHAGHSAAQFTACKDFITMRHLDNMGKVMLATGLIVAYGYIMEAVHGLVQRQHLRVVHAPEPHDRALRAGATGRSFSATCSSRKRSGSSRCERNVPCCSSSSLIVQRRHVAGTLHDRRHQPAPRFHARRLGHVLADHLGLGDLLGTIGLFRLCFFLFVRLLPMISMSEMRELVAETSGEHSRRLPPEYGEYGM